MMGPVPVSVCPVGVGGRGPRTPLTVSLSVVPASFRSWPRFHVPCRARSIRDSGSVSALCRLSGALATTPGWTSVPVGSGSAWVNSSRLIAYGERSGSTSPTWGPVVPGSFRASSVPGSPVCSRPYRGSTWTWPRLSVSTLEIMGLPGTSGFVQLVSSGFCSEVSSGLSYHGRRRVRREVRVHRRSGPFLRTGRRVIGVAPLVRPAVGGGAADSGFAGLGAGLGGLALLGDGWRVAGDSVVGGAGGGLAGLLGAGAVLRRLGGLLGAGHRPRPVWVPRSAGVPRAGSCGRCRRVRPAPADSSLSPAWAGRLGRTAPGCRACCRAGSSWGRWSGRRSRRTARAGTDRRRAGPHPARPSPDRPRPADSARSPAASRCQKARRCRGEERRVLLVLRASGLRRGASGLLAGRLGSGPIALASRLAARRTAARGGDASGGRPSWRTPSPPTASRSPCPSACASRPVPLVSACPAAAPCRPRSLPAARRTCRHVPRPAARRCHRRYLRRSARPAAAGPRGRGRDRPAGTAGRATRGCRYILYRPAADAPRSAGSARPSVSRPADWPWGRSRPPDVVPLLAAPPSRDRGSWSR